MSEEDQKEKKKKQTLVNQLREYDLETEYLSVSVTKDAHYKLFCFSPKFIFIKKYQPYHLPSVNIRNKLLNYNNPTFQSLCLSSFSKTLLQTKINTSSFIQNVLHQRRNIGLLESSMDYEVDRIGHFEKLDFKTQAKKRVRNKRGTGRGAGKKPTLLRNFKNRQKLRRKRSYVSMLTRGKLVGNEKDDEIESIVGSKVIKTKVKKSDYSSSLFTERFTTKKLLKLKTRRNKKRFSLIEDFFESNLDPKTAPYKFETFFEEKFKEETNEPKRNEINPNERLVVFEPISLNFTRLRYNKDLVNEKYRCSVSLYDTINEIRLSENYYFQLPTVNKKQEQVHEQIQEDQGNNNNNNKNKNQKQKISQTTQTKRCIFKINKNENQKIVIVIRIQKKYSGDYDTMVEDYFENLNKNKKQKKISKKKQQQLDFIKNFQLNHSICYQDLGFLIFPLIDCNHLKIDKSFKNGVDLNPLLRYTKSDLDQEIKNFVITDQSSLELIKKLEIPGYLTAKIWEIEKINRLGNKIIDSNFQFISLNNTLINNNENENENENNNKKINQEKKVLEEEEEESEDELTSKKKSKNQKNKQGLEEKEESEKENIKNKKKKMEKDKEKKEKKLKKEKREKKEEESEESDKKNRKKKGKSKRKKISEEKKEEESEESDKKPRKKKKARKKKKKLDESEGSEESERSENEKQKKLKTKTKKRKKKKKRKESEESDESERSEKEPSKRTSKNKTHKEEKSNINDINGMVLQKFSSKPDLNCNLKYYHNLFLYPIELINLKREFNIILIVIEYKKQPNLQRSGLKRIYGQLNEARFVYERNTILKQQKDILSFFDEIKIALKPIFNETDHLLFKFYTFTKQKTYLKLMGYSILHLNSSNLCQDVNTIHELKIYSRLNETNYLNNQGEIDSRNSKPIKTVFRFRMNLVSTIYPKNAILFEVYNNWAKLDSKNPPIDIFIENLLELNIQPLHILIQYLHPILEMYFNSLLTIEKKKPKIQIFLHLVKYLSTIRDELKNLKKIDHLNLYLEYYFQKFQSYDNEYFLFVEILWLWVHFKLQSKQKHK
ncbi:dedicator of cytokinesis dock [Anaeramoeba flamelloides]|uniref:Dedicator of cytokinesis dock n=1 Tax=Anaeramoeba flamelloides TaxID=1746091 RepID=A0ABQ8XZA7_9EUKA|nr:dedicator of cytokinesis dock [Anaeramoeba flamelloides]